MVHSSYKTCMVCLIKKRAQKTDARAQKTDAHVRAEQTAAAGSVTAGAIATLVAERDAMAVGGMTVAVSSITDATRRGLEAMREEAMRDERAKITEAQRRARSKWWLGNVFRLWRPTFSAHDEAQIWLRATAFSTRRVRSRALTFRRCTPPRSCLPRTHLKEVAPVGSAARLQRRGYFLKMSRP